MRYVLWVMIAVLAFSTVVRASSIDLFHTSQGGTMSASGSYSSSYAPQYAFDGNDSTSWRSSISSSTRYIIRTLPTSQTVTRIRVLATVGHGEVMDVNYRSSPTDAWHVIAANVAIATAPSISEWIVSGRWTIYELQVLFRGGWGSGSVSVFSLEGYNDDALDISSVPEKEFVRITITGGSAPFSVYRNGVLISTGDTTEYLDFEYPPGQEVVYTVQDSTGLQASVTVLTRPAAPTIEASAGVDNISLSWTEVSSAIKYIVYRNGVKVGETSDTRYTDSNLAPDTAFSYSVSAANTSGEGRQSDPVTVRTLPQPPPPDAPANLRLTGRTATSISVAWDPVPGVSGYRVYLHGTLVTLTPNTSWTFSGLTPGTQYTVQVQAYSGAYAGAISTTLTCSTVGVPGMPVNLTATAGASQVTLTWAPPAVGDPPTGYRVYRGSTLVGDTTDTYFSDTGLTVSTVYTYEVRAYNEAGEGPGAIVQVTTQNLPLPEAPTGLTLVATQRTIQASWASVQWALGYRIYLNGTYLDQTPVAQYKIKGLLPSTTYVVDVTAYNDAGESTPTSGTVQSLPGNVSLTVSPYGTGYVARWDPPGQTLDDLPDRYNVLVDGATVAAIYETYYGDGKLGWSPGSTHTITVEAYYGTLAVPSSATVTALAATVSVDPDTTARAVAFSVASLWPLLAVVTAIGLGFLVWDKFRSLIPR